MSENKEQEMEGRITQLEQEVRRLTLLVDRVYSYTHLGIHKPSFPNNEVLAGAPPETVDAELQQLIQRKDVINAAKRYVQLTGLGLLEAKAAVMKLIPR